MVENGVYNALNTTISEVGINLTLTDIGEWIYNKKFLICRIDSILPT